MGGDAMSADSLVYRFLPRLALPLLAAVVFILLWLAVARFTNRLALRLVAASVGALLALVVVFLYLWGQASGS